MNKSLNAVWNPRYIEYCRIHEILPGTETNNTKFMLWIQDRWREWVKLNHSDCNHLTEQDHKDFDVWLKSYQPNLIIKEGS